MNKYTIYVRPKGSKIQPRKDEIRAMNESQLKLAIESSNLELIEIVDSIDENAINIEKTDEVFGLELTPNREGGFGCCMFVHKENYSTIPNDMKIWGGDDWLFVNCLNKIKNNYKLVGFKIEGEMSVTCNQSEFNPIKENDLKLKEKYNLIIWY